MQAFSIENGEFLVGIGPLEAEDHQRVRSELRVMTSDIMGPIVKECGVQCDAYVSLSGSNPNSENEATRALFKGRVICENQDCKMPSLPMAAAAALVLRISGETA